MGRTVDRRTGWLVLALSATMFLVVVASLRPERVDEGPVLRRLVERSVRADGFDHTLTERTTRTVRGVGTTSAAATTIWVARPRWRAESSGDLTVVTTPDGTFTCRREPPTTCLTEPSAPRPQSAAAPYLAAVTTGRYSIVRLGRDRWAGEAVECFRLDARSPDSVLPGLGDRLVVCLTADGLVLRSIRRAGAVTDRREVLTVRRSVSAEDRQRIAEAVQHTAR